MGEKLTPARVDGKPNQIGTTQIPALRTAGRRICPRRTFCWSPRRSGPNLPARFTQQPNHCIMDLIFNCPKCGQELEVDASGAGEEINCPSCNQTIRIPESGPVTAASPSAAASAAAAPATGNWAAAAQQAGQAGAIGSSAAAKIEMHLKVPVRSTRGETLIAKPSVPLEAAARTSDRQLQVKCIRHVDCVEVGHDRFDETVSNFLAKIGEANMVSITTLAYSHIDISSQKQLTDYGVMILWQGLRERPPRRGLKARQDGKTAARCWSRSGHCNRAFQSNDYGGARPATSPRSLRPGNLQLRFRATFVSWPHSPDPGPLPKTHGEPERKPASRTRVKSHLNQIVVGCFHLWRLSSSA